MQLGLCRSNFLHQALQLGGNSDMLHQPCGREILMLQLPPSYELMYGCRIRLSMVKNLKMMTDLSSNWKRTNHVFGLGRSLLDRSFRCRRLLAARRRIISSSHALVDRSSCEPRKTLDTHLWTDLHASLEKL